ncbi:MAG: methylenetetrahydrofolate reductase [NAD(P)H], partial [Fimbriimonadaceae bacterium]|nr:methylenetetrahydrofolate reductase [NAD(P)H] [Fimbriimonadaceae bacterium]
SFVSVTYGAGGGTRERTVSVARAIKKDFGIEAVAHLTCIGHRRDELEELVDALVDAGIENVLALRGDHVPGVSEGELRYAAELIALIRQRHPDLCIGAACYPEKHLEAPDFEIDVNHLKSKVDAGVDFLVTQLFFKNRYYFDFLDRVNSAGIKVPIVPGLMPVTNVAQIERFTQMCGAEIPEPLHERLDKWRDDEQAVVATGIEWAIRQGRELLAKGAPGLHFYTLNRSLATRVVHASLSGI